MAKSLHLFLTYFFVSQLNGSKVQSLTNGLHVANSARKLSNVQLARPLASVCGMYLKICFAMFGMIHFLGLIVFQ